MSGGGLRLVVRPNGLKAWHLAYRFEGNQRTLVLGPYPEVSLATARGMRDDAKRILRDGFDPGAKKLAGKTIVSFESVVLSSFENDVFPEIGKMHVAQIEPQDIKPPGSAGGPHS
ncbi:Arm DNA-binding domain-containing protein [Ancylobacter sp. G4_0304]